MSVLQQLDVIGGSGSGTTSGPGNNQEAVQPWAELPDAAIALALRTPATRIPTGRRVSAAEAETSTEDPRARRKQIGKAAAELRRRHLPALLDYARLCGRPASAEDLALDAFQHAVREIRTAPRVAQPSRYDLLRHVPKTAARWAASGRRADLAPEFLAWLDGNPHSATGQPPSASLPLDATPALRAFRRLPDRARAILWHTVVEHDDPEETGRLLGVRPKTVPLLGRRALEHFRGVCLEAHADASDGRQCRGFGSLLEAATRCADARPSADIDQHLAGCPSCTHVHTLLAGMNERPDATLAEALLPWGGAALVAMRRPRTTTGTTPNRPPGRRGAARHPAGSGRRAASHVASRTASVSGAGRLLSLAGKFPVASVTAAVGLTVAAAALVPLPMVGGNTGSAAGPLPSDTPRSTPDGGSAPTPAVSTPPEPIAPPAPSYPPPPTNPPLPRLSLLPDRHSAGVAEPCPRGAGRDTADCHQATHGHTPPAPHSAPAPPHPDHSNSALPLPASVQAHAKVGTDTSVTSYLELLNGRSSLRLDVGHQFPKIGADVLASPLGADVLARPLGADVLAHTLDSGGGLHARVGVGHLTSSAGEPEHDTQLLPCASAGRVIPLGSRVFPDQSSARTASDDNSGGGVGIPAIQPQPQPRQTWLTGETASMPPRQQLPPRDSLFAPLAADKD
ncbi:hypothetical protein FCH28_00795 [Streptomyces piniterrae]|uniref:Sigma-70 family RNA polymerase sigma factor n=1 Tax=Streptomyces piniterrae TaxID=2571125 RepID=A0A4U0NVJ9_9ACTN|nr:hypothetical protein [Streptomyces piniterrae]TJZ58745.1 hypothetical protein FCH28_00795 [Streptomyces piniterrae]